MKLSDFVKDVELEIEQDKIKHAKSILKERLLEIQRAKKILNKMETQLKDLIGKDIDDV